VAIPLQPLVLVLLRPHLLVVDARSLQLNPGQRGFRKLADVTNRTILWRVANVNRSVEDHVSMDSFSYIRQESWIVLEVHYKDSSSVLLSLGRINCSRSEDHFQDGTLGEKYVGCHTRSPGISIFYRK